MALWGSVCDMVSGPLQQAILDLPLKVLDAEIMKTGSFLTEEEMGKMVSMEDYEAKLANLLAVAGDVSSLYKTMRWILAVYSILLMLKFFKAFKANPRLNIVTQTLVVGSVDIIHFFLVFFVIYLCFVVMATVLFGHKIRTFSSFSHSMAMCFRILMGDFDYEEMEAVDYQMTIFWFMSFQIFLFLILFNMLLAIIMDTYSGVAGAEENPQTIWFQAMNTLRKTQKQRGHLSLWYLICEFEDDDFPAHPDNVVTPKSLRKAFNKMSKHNAEYLVEQANLWVISQEGHSDLTISDTVRLVGRVDSVTNKIQNTVHLIYEKIKEEARKPMERRLDAIMAGEDMDAMPGGGMPGQGGFMHAIKDGGTGGLANGHAMAHHGAMVRAGPDPKMLQAMQQMQAQLEQQQALIQRQQEYLEQRDAWIEQRIMFMERRSEKVELSAERLIAAMQKLDVDNLSHMPDQIENLAQMVNMMYSNSSTNQQQAVAQQLQSLNAQIARLQQVADEDSQARQVLYRLDVNGKQMKATQAQGQNETVNQLRSLGAQINALLYHAEEDADKNRMNCKSTLKQFRAAHTAGREFPLFSQSLPAPPLENRSRVDSSATSANSQGQAPGTSSVALRQTGAAIADQQRSYDQGSDASRPGSSSEGQGIPHDFHAPPVPQSLPGQMSSSLPRAGNNGNNRQTRPPKDPPPADASDGFV
jgi:hypothetical protein